MVQVQKISERHFLRSTLGDPNYTDYKTVGRITHTPYHLHSCLLFDAPRRCSSLSYQHPIINIIEIEPTSSAISKTIDKLLDHIQNVQDQQQLRFILHLCINYFDLSKITRANTHIQHTINTDDSHPISSRPYPRTIKQRRELQDEIQLMLQTNQIRPFNSPWSSPVIIHKKKDGDSFPQPTTEGLLHRLGGHFFYTKVDLKSGQARFRQAVVTAVATTVEKVSNELVKSQMKNGRFINSFNPKFKLPHLGHVLSWKITSPKNTRLPSSKQELDRILPIIRYQRPEELYLTTSGLRFIWIGHASCFVQMNNFRFLVDPIFSERCGIASFIGPKRFRPPALTVNDLPHDLDAILISHNHFDHLDYPSVKSLNKRYGEQLTWFCGRGTRQWFLDSGIKNVIELDWWEQFQYAKKDVKIAFCPAQHWSRRTAFDTNKSLWGGYAVWDSTHRFYFAGDTGYTHDIPIFKQIGDKYGPFNLSAIPIGAYEPRWMMQAQHVSPDEAVQMHIDVQSQKSIGIHWGTWAMANEYFMEPPEKLSQAVQFNQLDPSSFIVVRHGEIFDLP
ncbi:unnamed protein product [Rotaria socialis]